QLIYIGEIRSRFAMKHKDPYLNMNCAFMEGAAPESPLFEIFSWNSKTHDTIVKMGPLYLSNVQNAAGDTIEPWGTLSIPLSFTAGDTTTPDSGMIIILNAIPIQGVNPSATVFYIDKIWFDN